MPSAQHYPLYILSPPSPLFASHWSFFIPDKLIWTTTSKRFEESDAGRRIHVSGDRLNGFTLEIVRGYCLSKDRGVSRDRAFRIGVVPYEFVTASIAADDERNVEQGREKDEDEGGGCIDNTPRDTFEEICIEVEAPGPSLASAIGTQGEKGRVKEVRDCQWWVRRVCEVLRERGVLVALDGEGVERMVAGVPRN